MESLAGDLANYNWKIFACSAVFDNIYFQTAGAIDRFFLRVEGAAMQVCTMTFDFVSIWGKQN